MNIAEFLKDNPDAQAEIDAMATAAAEKAVGSLSQKNEQLMDELKPLKDLKKKLGDDFTLEDYNQLRQSLAEKEKKGFVDKGQIDKVIEAHDSEREQWKEQYQKDITERDEKINAYATEVQSLVVDTELTRELSAIAVDDGALDYLLYKAKPLIETVEANGKTVARVKGQVKGDGTHKTITDLVAEFGGDDSLSRYVKGSNQGGSGAPQHAGGGNRDQNLTATQRIARGLKKQA